MKKDLEIFNIDARSELPLSFADEGIRAGFLSPAHNGGKSLHRMPLILPKEKEENCLEPNLSEKQIKSLLQTFPSNDMDAYAVIYNFRKKNPHDKIILEEVG